MKVHVVSGTWRHSVVHTDPDCPCLKGVTGTVREVYRACYPNRRVCKHCSGEAQRDGGPWKGQCATCEAVLVDGECPFCSREIVQEVLG